MAISIAFRHYFLVSLLALPRLGAADSTSSSNLIREWNSAALQGIRDSNLGAPEVARTLAVVHTCMYDAWSAYDDRAFATELRGALRRPLQERTAINKQKAISYAAYRALIDVLPVDSDLIYRPLMRRLGYDPNDRSKDIDVPQGVANVSCDAVLELRHHDGANQLGDLAQGAYSDWTHYAPVNKPAYAEGRRRLSTSTAVDRWQPLVYVDAKGDLMTQRFGGAQWCYVIPFAIQKGDQFRSLIQRFGPAKRDSVQFPAQAQELIDLSAHLTDTQKMISEYWSDSPTTVQPPGHWFLFAQYVSLRDRHTLDQDVKMFFVLANAMFDSGIATWDTKRAFDSVRPITAIPTLFAGKLVHAWGGPGKGSVEMDGAKWRPYELATFPTPPSPDYVSGHSTFSSAAAEILLLWTGSDRFGNSVMLEPGTSQIEPGITPAHPITLHWATFTQAADQAGISRRYGGIHFKAADLAGRLLGRLVAVQVWAKAQSYFEGTAPPVLQQPIGMAVAGGSPLLSGPLVSSLASQRYNSKLEGF